MNRGPGDVDVWDHFTVTFPPTWVRRFMQVGALQIVFNRWPLSRQKNVLVGDEPSAENDSDDKHNI
jgi:hypothetical protein